VIRLVLPALVAMAACAHDKRTNAKSDEPTPSGALAPDHSRPAAGNKPEVVVVTNRAEAKAAIGKRVHVRGVAERDKLGDAVSSQGFSVVCLAPRFPQAQIDQPIDVEGILELTDAFQATTGPKGEISQGTAPGTSSYVIQTCTLR
jgi:hypothetical protein